MNRRTVRADVARLAQVLAGLRYPAAKWQIIAHADHYGADSVSTAQLWSLPVAVYQDLAAVCVALGVLPGGAYLAQPGLQASAAEQPPR
ncbi:hypothetical protein GCM10009836_27650 [Pseudonocardia ailaonensis]|uniref:DUF3263 domain-containing protein n=1 Tax=Pseudonocardia ailaonensis TaxID=367279 RepID=A0ABN2N1G4_9PSEU